MTITQGNRRDDVAALVVSQLCRKLIELFGLTGIERLGEQSVVFVVPHTIEGLAYDRSAGMIKYSSVRICHKKIAGIEEDGPFQILHQGIDQDIHADHAHELVASDQRYHHGGYHYLLAPDIRVKRIDDGFLHRVFWYQIIITRALSFVIGHRFNDDFITIAVVHIGDEAACFITILGVDIEGVDSIVCIGLPDRKRTEEIVILLEHDL